MTTKKAVSAETEAPAAPVAVVHDIHAPGAAGKAARARAKANADGSQGGFLKPYDRPGAKYADDDTSIDARMWRLRRDHEAMGSR